MGCLAAPSHPLARKSLAAGEETDAYKRMLALQRQDLAVMPSFAPFGARLLRPPGELPPLAAGEGGMPAVATPEGRHSHH